MIRCAAAPLAARRVPAARRAHAAAEQYQRDSATEMIASFISYFPPIISFSAPDDDFSAISPRGHAEPLTPIDFLLRRPEFAAIVSMPPLLPPPLFITAETFHYAISSLRFAIIFFFAI